LLLIQQNGCLTVTGQSTKEDWDSRIQAMFFTFTGLGYTMGNKMKKKEDDWHWPIFGIVFMFAFLYMMYLQGSWMGLSVGIFLLYKVIKDHKPKDTTKNP
jgi:hypothetical protein